MKRSLPMTPSFEFNALFGRFIGLYAIIETYMHGVFRRLCNLDEETARAITGGMRLADIVAVIKRLCHPPRVSSEVEREVADIFNQLSLITKLRDSLIHRGMTADGDTDSVLSSNARTARSPESIEILRVNSKGLDDAAYDLGFILLKITALFMMREDYKSTPEDKKFYAQPWHYKPQPLERPYLPSQKEPQHR